MKKYFCFSKIVRVTLSDYTQRSAYKRYNVVGNHPDSVGLFESSDVIPLVN